MSGTLRSFNNKLKGTTRITVKRVGAANDIDLGNVIKFAHAPKLARVEHMTAAVGDVGGGFARGDGNLITTIADIYTFTLDEISNDTLRLLNLTAAAAAANQASAPTHAITIAAVEPGETYRLGFYGLTAHALTFGSTSKTEGTDFTLDYASGLLTILTGGAIMSGDAVAGTVAVPAVKYNSATNTSEMRVVVSVVIEIKDQLSVAPREIITIGSAELYCTNWGDVEHAKFNEWQGEIYCLTQPVVKERQD